MQNNVLPNDIKESHFELPQCVSYEDGQAFKEHFDTDMNDNNKRKYIVLVYLNDDFEGGETSFPAIGFEFKPKKVVHLFSKIRMEITTLMSFLFMLKTV